VDGAAYAYLLGVYLGDGHIAAVGRTYGLRIYLDSRYPRIVEEIQKAIIALMPRNRASVHQRQGTNCAVVSSYSNDWPAAFPQHGPGRKHDSSASVSASTNTPGTPFPTALNRSSCCSASTSTYSGSDGHVPTKSTSRSLARQTSPRWTGSSDPRSDYEEL
jgi:hypothetical protein